MHDHCMSVLKQEDEKLLYQIYITDALKYITENTAKRVQGVYIPKRYIEYIRPEKAPKHTEKEVISNLKSKLRKQ